jgi:hypothetical protein
VTHVVAPLFLGSRNDFFALDAVRLAGSADSYRRERGVESLPLHGGMDELSVHGKYFLEYEILAANGAVEFLRERPEGLPFPHSLPFLWFQSANFAGWDRKRHGVSQRVSGDGDFSPLFLLCVGLAHLRRFAKRGSQHRCNGTRFLNGYCKFKFNIFQSQKRGVGCESDPALRLLSAASFRRRRDISSPPAVVSEELDESPPRSD